MNIVPTSGTSAETRSSGSPTTASPCASSASLTTRSTAAATVQETVHWIRIVAFGKTAQLVAEHKHQGDEVFVEGSLAYSEWTDADDNRRTALKVRAHKAQVGHRRSISDAAA